MDTCPAHIEPKLWKSSCLLRIQVRNADRLKENLDRIEKEVEEENEKRESECLASGKQFIPLDFAKEEGDCGYEEKSQLKSFELEISDKISSWEASNR